VWILSVHRPEVVKQHLTSQTLRIPEAEPHSKPLSKRVENVSLPTLSGHLKGGVHDHPFKRVGYMIIPLNNTLRGF
jgi:hypothetical protein